jgi:hypothetical protein
VSQWISGGKIHGKAIVGTGRSARIRTFLAKEQLRQKLDIDHRVRSSTKAHLDALPFAQPPASAAPGGSGSNVELLIQAERLEGFRRDNRRKAEEEAARSGRYVRAVDSSRWIGKIAAMLINIFEGWLGEVASKLSARFGLNQRDVLHLLRGEFRLFRATASAALRRESEQLPAEVEDEATPDEVPVAVVEQESDDG